MTTWCKHLKSYRNLCDACRTTHNATVRERRKETVKLCRAAGLCTRCFKADAVAGKCRCVRCIAGPEERRATAGRPIAATTLAAIEAWQESRNVPATAARFGVHPKTLYQALRRHGHVVARRRRAA